jgi:hypothetical protein
MREEPSSTTNSSIFARLSSVQGGRRSIFRNPFAGRTQYTRSSSIYSRPGDFGFDFDIENVPPVPALNPRHQLGPTGTTPRIGNFGDFFPRREEEPLPPVPPMPTAFGAAARGAYDRQVSPLVGSVPSNTSSPSGLSTEWRSPTPVQPIWGGPSPEVLEDSMPIRITRSRSSDRVPLTATTRMTDETRTEEREQRRRQKKRKRKHHRQPEAWTRPHRRGTGRGRQESLLHRGPPNGQNIYVTPIVAGLFLLATAATCKSFYLCYDCSAALIRYRCHNSAHCQRSRTRTSYSLFYYHSRHCAFPHPRSHYSPLQNSSHGWLFSCPP